MLELMLAGLIPLLFLFLGLAFLVISQITGYFQFQQYLTRHQRTRALFMGYAARISGSELLLRSRARQLGKLTGELKRSNEELSRLNTAKSKFLSMAAHDMRNPVTAIEGFEKLLSRQTADPRSKEHLTHIRSSVLHIESLLSELTDLALIEAGKLRVEPAELELCGLVRELVEAQAPLARQKGLSLMFESAEDELRAEADAGRLRRVLQNLLDNAMKFTPAGGRVQVVLRRDGGRAAVLVSDTGAGLLPEERERIFEQFYQSPRAGRREGWGLGLSIAMEIVRLHGGTIGADSAGKGKGSTFWVRLPLRQPRRRTEHGRRA